jgi:hypothetical protein
MGADRPLVLVEALEQDPQPALGAGASRKTWIQAG